MKRFLIVSMILGLVWGSLATAEAGQSSESSGRTVEGSYPAVPDPLSGCDPDRGTFACVIVDAHPMEAFFTAKVKDAHGQPVFVQVLTAGGWKVGTFCGETTEPVSFPPGSSLQFLIEPTPYFWSHWGVDWLGPLDCPYRLATTGTISVTLSDWPTSDEPSSPSTEPSESPAPESSPSGQPKVVERSVDLAMKRHLRGIGVVVAEDASCRSDVPVVIERKTAEAWRQVAQATTDADGAFSVRLTDSAGRYRAIATEIGTTERTCLVARSATVRHRH